MSITKYISLNGGYISSAEAKEKSLYNQLLYGVEKGTVIRVRRGIYALNEGLAKPMVDVERLVPGGVLLKIYDLEKSVCDAIKYRNRVGIDVSSEILRNYLSRKDCDITKL